MVLLGKKRLKQKKK